MCKYNAVDLHIVWPRPSLLEFSADGQLVAVGMTDGVVNVWDYARERVKTFQASGKADAALCHSDTAPFHVSFENSSTVLLAYRDATVKRRNLADIPWEKTHYEDPVAKYRRAIEESATREQLELETAPNRLRKASGAELKQALSSLGYILGNRSLEETRTKIDTDSPWREELTTELEKLLASGNSDIRQQAAMCLSKIPSKRVTEIIVESIRERKPYVNYFYALSKSAGFDRLNPKHPAALTLEQQRAIVPGLIEIIENEPLNWAAQEVLSEIPDQRVLPFFFKQLDLEIVDHRLQRRVVGHTFLHRIFIEYKLYDHIPTDKRDSAAMPPERSAELWRAWYKENGQRLVWNEESKRYQLKP